MKEINLEQGTPEWHDWRRGKAMASETAAVMGISPYQSIEQIRNNKRGSQKSFVTSAMQHGNDEEPKAREAYEQDVDELFQPACYESGEYGASLDGINMDGDTLLEIKSPVDGKDSERYKQAAEDAINDFDYIQVQHQLMVTGAKRCVFLVWGGDQYATVTVMPNPGIWEQIVSAWDSFWPTVAERDDQEWREASEAYKEAKKVADEAATALTEAKKHLLTFMSGTYAYGNGVRVKEVVRSGQVDWKKIQAEKLTDVDVEQYRKPGSSYIQVELVEGITGEKV